MSEAAERLEHGRETKKRRVWFRLIEEFATCSYLNSGAYSEIPTIRGNLEERTKPTGAPDNEQ